MNDIGIENWGLGLGWIHLVETQGSRARDWSWGLGRDGGDG